jgi:hypothetical protein
MVNEVQSQHWPRFAAAAGRPQACVPAATILSGMLPFLSSFAVSLFNIHEISAGWIAADTVK